MPYRTSSWTLLRVRRGPASRHLLFALAGVVLVIVCAPIVWMAVFGPERIKSFVALLCLVPFTALWIAVLVDSGRARVAFYVEGFVSGGRTSEAVSWNAVAGVRRAKQDPEVTHPPGWIIETQSGDEVHLPGWLVQPDVDLAPLRDRGFELPAS